MGRFIADIAVVGAGPAGLSVACDLAARGCSVALLTVGDAIQWCNTYGVWTDDLSNSRIASAVAQQWPHTHVVLPDGTRQLGRGYALVNNAAAVAVFEAVIAELGITQVHERAVSIEHDDLGSTVRLTSGESVRATLVIDATGSGVFTVRDGASDDLWQLAVGRHISGSHPYPPDAMRLMDFRSHGLYAGSERASFLYAMPMKGGVFVEETFLIAPGSTDLRTLERRLDARLQRDGVSGDVVGDTETVRIPMANSLPSASQRVVPFGAAAGFIHPATGYSVGRSLRESGPLADVIAQALGRGEAPHKVASQAMAHLWPEDARLAHDLLQFGGRFLASLDTEQTHAFFGAFFSTPQQTWVDYLRGDLAAGELAAAMVRIFRACPASLRVRMMWSGAQPATVLTALRSLTRTRRSA